MQMTDTKDTDRKDGTGRKPLTLNRSVSAGTVKQSFSHGRQKSVLVEVKKKRANVPEAGGPRPSFVPQRPAAGAPAPASAPVPQPAAPAQAERPAPSRPLAGGQLGLSARELEARSAALERARSMEDERRAREEADAEARARREDAERRKQEVERRAQEAEAARKARDEADVRAAEERARRVEELQKKVAEKIATQREIEEAAASELPARGARNRRRACRGCRARPPRPATDRA
jgi:translation initiation factor IF-2